MTTRPSPSGMTDAPSMSQRQHRAMRRLRWIWLSGFLAVIVTSGYVASPERTLYASPHRNGIPVAFVPNRGQFKPDTEFVAHGDGSQLHFTRWGPTLFVFANEPHTPASAEPDGNEQINRHHDHWTCGSSTQIRT